AEPQALVGVARAAMDEPLIARAHVATRTRGGALRLSSVEGPVDEGIDRRPQRFELGPPLPALDLVAGIEDDPQAEPLRHAAQRGYAFDLLEGLSSEDRQSFERSVAHALSQPARQFLEVDAALQTG